MSSPPPTEPERPEGRPRYSLVIPAYNEAVYLPRLLRTVDVARQCYTGGAAAIEVIVADNASTDATPRIAKGHGCKVVRVDKRVIAAARNGGAAASRGEILCFVDADMRIHPQTFDGIDQTLATGRVVAGSTGVRLERWSLGLAVTFVVALPIIIGSRMDTGVVFCRKEDFEAIGGYNEARLFAEDAQFLWDLRRLGRRRGQRLARVTSVKAIASTRKFDKYGQWHYLTQLPRLAVLMLRSPHATNEFANQYWYNDR